MSPEELRLLASYASFGLGHSPGWEDEEQANKAIDNALIEANRLEAEESGSSKPWHPKGPEDYIG